MNDPTSITISPATLAAMAALEKRSGVTVDHNQDPAAALLLMLSAEERDAIMPLVARLLGASPGDRRLIAASAMFIATMMDSE